VSHSNGFFNSKGYVSYSLCILVLIRIFLLFFLLTLLFLLFFLLCCSPSLPCCFRCHTLLVCLTTFAITPCCHTSLLCLVVVPCYHALLSLHHALLMSILCPVVFSTLLFVPCCLHCIITCALLLVLPYYSRFATFVALLFALGYSHLATLPLHLIVLPWLLLGLVVMPSHLATLPSRVVVLPSLSCHHTFLPCHRA
jgi:hypothetical protein